MNRLTLFLILISSVVRSQCLSGTFTVGGTAPDYVNFSSAINAISTNGICGHVFFKVRPGTYNEMISIPNWLTSVTKTVTFESESGDSTSVVLIADSAYTLTITAGFINISHITISSYGPECYGCVYIAPTSHDILLSSCVLNQSAGSIYGSGIVVADANKITISNNDIDVEVDGLSVGSSGLVLSDYLIDNNSINSGYNGGSINLVNGLVFTNNTIVSGTYAYDISQCQGNVIISGNSITGIEGGLVCNDFSSTHTLIVYNNFIRVSGGSAPIGLVIQNVDNTSVYHNTVRINSTSTSDPALLLTGPGTRTLRNNIFMNGSSGVAFYIQSGGVNDLDYNIYYTAGAKIGYSGVFHTTLANYTLATGQEASGMQINPQLISSTDLHINSTSPARDAGLALPSITNDIDGQVRETLSDIGADEYYPSIGITEFQEKVYGMLIYPNPSSGLVKIKFAGNEEYKSIEIYDVLGNFIDNVSIINSEIDISLLTPGVYFLRTPLCSVKCIKN